MRAAETRATPAEGAEHGEAAPESEATWANPLPSARRARGRRPDGVDPATASACPPVDAADRRRRRGRGRPELLLPCDPSLMPPTAIRVPMVQDEQRQPGADGRRRRQRQTQVLDRLGERRAELDAREQELEMRMALVEAAEKRIDERTAMLEALEARINALVDQNKSAEEGAVQGHRRHVRDDEAQGSGHDPRRARHGYAAARRQGDQPAQDGADHGQDGSDQGQGADRVDGHRRRPSRLSTVTAEDLAALPQIVGQ